MSLTWRQKFNKVFKLPLDTSHSIDDISNMTKINKSILQEAYNRGVGASKTNPESVRNKTTFRKRKEGYALSQRLSPEAWGMGRLYGLVMSNPKQVGEGKPDRDLYLEALKNKKN